MLRLYSVNGNCINTASATLPIANIVATAAVLPEILEVVLGSDAVASNAAKYAFQRGTTVGTWAGAGGAAVTPISQNPALTVTALTTANQGVCSVGPTLTANAFIYQIPLNQQASVISKFNPGQGLFCLNAASASLNLMSLVAAVAFNAVFSFTVSE